MKNKKLVSLLAMAALTASMIAGCGSTATEPATATEEPAQEEAAEVAEESTEEEAAGEEVVAEEATEEAAAEEDEENYDTGDASLDDPRNADEIGENELMVISFGTSYNDSRRLTIGAVEGAMEEAFPDWSVRRGFTSQIIIDHVKSRDGEVIDNVGEALDRAVANGVKKLVVQPTHLMDGLEYNDVVDEVAQYADAFDQIAIGKPLLTSDEDFKIVMEVITAETAEYDDGNTAICFMGHGTEADSNLVYGRMQDLLTEAGYEHYEISNFARPGFRSKHNSSYWRDIPYIGLGAAAHSYSGTERSWNCADLQAYIQAIGNGHRPCETEQIDANTHYNDIITTALRTQEGIDLGSLPCNQRKYLLLSASKYLDEGLLFHEQGRLHLTRQGIYLSDTIMSDLMWV